MFYSNFFLYLLIDLSSSSAFALSVPRASTLSPTNDLALDLAPLGPMVLLHPLSAISNLTGAYTCIPSSKYKPWTSRPTVRDCGGAIVRLPSGGDISEFKARAQNPFMLPVDREIGSCKITVGLAREATSARSSWTEIGLAATAMSQACIKGTRTGGRVFTGDQNKIEVALDYVKGFDPEYATGGSGTS